MATVSVRYIVNDVDEAISFTVNALALKRSCIQHRHSQCSLTGIFVLSSAQPVADPAVVRRCLMGLCLSLEDGIDSALRCLILPAPLKSCVAVVRGSAMTS